MAGAPNPAMLAALQGAGPGGPPAPAAMPPPPGVPPPGAGNPPGVGPAGAMGGMPQQIMLLSFLAGAGLDKIVASISKLRGTAGGSHKGGATKDAAQAPGMTIPPQMAQMIAQNPAMAARLMQLVRSQLSGGMPTPGGGV